MPIKKFDLNSLSNNNLSPKFSSFKPKSRKKVLVWSDSVLATTGFGIVSKHILKALYDTGLYEIDQLAINSPNQFYNRNEFPYTLLSAKLGDPSDPYGNQMFLTALQKKEYDIVFIINDTFVVESVAREIEKIREIKARLNQKPFSLVYYYPVDCRLCPGFTTMIKVADRSVAYTNFAKESSKKIGICPTDVIYHGVDIDTFKPISRSERNAFRKKHFGIDENTFLFVTVNRNSKRKDIARTILAFSEFRNQVTKNCRLYVHAKIVDGTGYGMETDLRVPIEELNLDIRRDVIFPTNLDAGQGYPAKVLNYFYNSADVFISTNLGEGWGLSAVESMACNVPVIIPNNTSAPEIFGENRGYLVECKELIYVDNSGFRQFTHIKDLLSQMKLSYNDWLEETVHGSQTRSTIVKNAQAFAQQYSWNNICKRWVRLFSELKPKEIQSVKEIGEKV